MGSNMLDWLIPARRYVLAENDEDAGEVETFVTAESGDGEVDLQISPREDNVVTISLSIEGTWKLIRQLAACAVTVEDDE